MSNQLDLRTVTQIADKRAQIKSLEADVKDLIAGLGIDSEFTEVVGDYVVEARPTRRFDAATAKNALSAVKFKSILELVPSSKRAKGVLSEEDYAKTQKQSGFTLLVAVPKDVA